MNNYYVIHGNINHDKLGRFTFGDGDGDGVTNERKSSKSEWRKVNRYQYANGTLTPAGAKRYEREIMENRQKSKKNRIDEDDLKDPKKWAKDDLNRAIETAKIAKSGLSDSEKLVDLVWKDKTVKRLDLSKMSDREIKEAINREIDEIRYNDLFNKPQENKGKTYVKEFLKANEHVAGIAVTGLSIAALIKMLVG